MPQLQHNVWALLRAARCSRFSRRRQVGRDHGSRQSALPTCFADGRAEILAVGETSHLFGVESPRPRLATVRLVDMTHRWIPVWIAMALALAGLRRQPVR
jgi:hypothetical protein